MYEVYDKHAGFIYACIYRLVAEKQIAEIFLKQIFIHLHKREECKTINIHNTFWYTKYAVQTTIAFLKNNSSTAFNVATVMQNTAVVSINKVNN